MEGVNQPPSPPEDGGRLSQNIMYFARALRAAAMGEAGVFLSLGRLESLGLTPLEAMACGCIVAGFTGIGGQEYASPANGFWAAEDDFPSCIKQLRAALGRLSFPMPEGREGDVGNSLNPMERRPPADVIVAAETRSGGRTLGLHYLMYHVSPMRPT